MTTDKMIAKKQDGIGWMIFNNPERHNAVSLEMWAAAGEILRDFTADPSVRVMVLAGAGGKAFVSGADISKFKEERSTLAEVEHYRSVGDRVFKGIEAFPKPTIAMIRGYCIGGGAALAVCCDIRVCTENSKFGIPAAKLGLGYRADGILRLVNLVGPAYAKEIFFTARQYDAREALAMGLVNRVVPDAELETYVTDMASTIVANAPLTVNSVKRIVGEVQKDRSERDEALCEQLVRDCYASQDYVEGRTAFMEKRKPVFVGR
jgi:enoyl-CoA hydratase/carnithine racemase